MLDNVATNYQAVALLKQHLINNTYSFQRSLPIIALFSTVRGGERFQ
jgi:hypothetical protein